MSQILVPIESSSSFDSLIPISRKSTPRIKQRVTSYHITEVIAHRKAKRGCHGNVPQHLWTPSNTWFLRPIPAHNPNGIPIGSAVFAHTTVECPYTLQWDAHSPPNVCPFPLGDLDPI